MAGRVDLRISVTRKGKVYHASFVGKAPDWPIAWKKGVFRGDTPTKAVERVLSHIDHIAKSGHRANAYRVARHLARGTDVLSKG